jgi:2-octaprenyl-6-methoxyphenol hydroxylase
VADRYDIVIAGGGPVGSALALSLCNGGHRVALLDARSRISVTDDPRMIALSRGSRLILERLGAWRLLPDPTPITNIVVSQQHQFGRVDLSADEAGVPALGYVVGYAGLQSALAAVLTGTTVDMLTGCTVREAKGTADCAVVNVESGHSTRQLEARLVAIADGSDALQLAHVEERDYRQSAVVCEVASDQPHRNCAFERFTPDGPLALLPTQRGWSLVWSARPARAVELAGLDDARFCAELHAAFGATLGLFSMLGARQVFPLRLKFARRPVAQRTVLVGNAAQTLHPVAGQGFNLGLRDAWELAAAVRDVVDPGNQATLNDYFSERRFDRTATILFTDTLIRLFSNDIPLFERMRGVGLAALNGISPAKNFLARRMMFGMRS